MDETSGFHQTLLDPASRSLAAFITQFGIFEPMRVMFGLKSAPSYFQEVMAIEVLADLLHQLCEIYIDDIVTWGTSEDNFLANLRQVFQRLREKNVSLHPDKVKLGVKFAEFVGHVIDKYGVQMSEEKISKVVDFVKPVTLKDMQSFLGVTNYFRDHVGNHSTITKPLVCMVVVANKKPKRGRALLIWTKEGEQAFERIKKMP
jgi:hypothetical protein